MSAGVKLTGTQRAWVGLVLEPVDSRPWTVSLAVIAGKLLDMGIVRVVKHRDHTQTYVLTDAGRAALKNY